MLICLTIVWRTLAYFILFLKSTSPKKQIKRIKQLSFINKLFKHEPENQAAPQVLFSSDKNLNEVI